MGTSHSSIGKSNSPSIKSIKGISQETLDILNNGSKEKVWEEKYIQLIKYAKAKGVASTTIYKALKAEGSPFGESSTRRKIKEVVSGE